MLTADYIIHVYDRHFSKVNIFLMFVLWGKCLMHALSAPCVCRGEPVQPVSDLGQGAAANPSPPRRHPRDQVQWKRQALHPPLHLPEGQTRRLLRPHPAGTQRFWERGGCNAWFLGHGCLLASASRSYSLFRLEMSFFFFYLINLLCSRLLLQSTVSSHTEYIALFQLSHDSYVPSVQSTAVIHLLFVLFCCVDPVLNTTTPTYSYRKAPIWVLFLQARRSIY